MKLKQFKAEALIRIHNKEKADFYVFLLHNRKNVYYTIQCMNNEYFNIAFCWQNSAGLTFWRQNWK